MKVALVEFFAEYLFDFEDNDSIDSVDFYGILDFILYQFEADLLT